VRGAHPTRRLLRTLDDALERLATAVFGPLPEGERRPGLAVKLSVGLLFAVLVLLGLGAQGCLGAENVPNVLALAPPAPGVQLMICRSSGGRFFEP